MPVANPAAAFEDDSDENVSLDLHVSDNDEEEKIKNNDITMENEDEILNKFDVADDATKQKLDKVNGTIVRKDTETVNQIEQTLQDALKSTDVIVSNGAECNGTESSNVKEAVSECVNKEEKKSDDVQAVKESSKDEGESEDFLLVLQETTSDADENHDEASNSDDVEEDSGENNEAPEETTHNEEMTQTDETKDDQAEEEDAMEIEEPPDHIDIIEENVRMSGESETVSERKEKTDMLILDEAAKKTTTDDDNKENEKNSTAKEGDERKSVLESILTTYLVKGRKETTTKPSKRLLEEGEQDTSKRAKLDTEAKSIVKLTNFKRFMLDKKMTGLTRDQLEELCIQKMCECIVQRSEIGELKMKIKAHEQVLDSLRKEAVLLGKQTRDLNIVHQKVIQDVSKMQENRDKPLILPKITRSVGLQAYVRNEDTRKTKKIPITTPAATLITRSPKVNGLTPIVARSSPISRPNPQQKSVATTSPRQQQNAKSATPQTPPIIATGTPQRNDKGVIDLTDEDDKARNLHPNIPNGTKVNMINPPNGHKFVVLPNGQPMMVKLGSIKPNSNIVMPQSLLRPGQNGVTNVPNSSNKVVRSSNVRIGSTANIGLTTGKRQTAPVQGNIRSWNNYQVNQKIIRHPAPLPTGPDQPGIYSSKAVPPKPQLMLNKTPCGTGIVLSWKMPYKLELYEEIASYQLYAYQETKSEPKTDSWGKIGDVKALELPMAVTLTQFAVGNRYYFAVRAVDVLTRHGSFSEYQTILL